LLCSEVGMGVFVRHAQMLVPEGVIVNAP
jgi:hypothetical protein